MFLERVGAMLNMRGAATVPRRRRQRSMKFAKSWECKKSQTALHGGEVARYCLDGRIKEVADYCETDIVNTYRVWLRYELFRGRLTNAELEATETALFLNSSKYAPTRSRTSSI
jgi:predicted PolB exonuclease-like 3'-5' exonuclease